MFIIVALGLVVLLVIVALRTSGSRRSGVQVVRVPVDDFVVGDLPMVCVRTGMAADGLVDFESGEDKFQAWWILLLLLGPLGVLAIVVLYAMSPTPRRVGGSLPMSKAALDAHNRRRRVFTKPWAVPFAGLALGALVLPVSRSPWIGATGVVILFLGLIGGFVMIATAGWSYGRNDVGVALDGTGRWVELRNVHPEFAATAARQVRDRHRRNRVRDHRSG